AQARAIEWRKAQVANPSEPCVVARGDRTPVLNPRRQMPELRIQDGCMNVVKERGVAVVMKLAGLSIFSVVTKERNGSRNLRVIRGDGSAIAIATEHLERVEAPTADTERTRALSVLRRTDRLTRIFHDEEAPLVGDGHEPIHVAHAAVQMDGNDGLRPGGDR